MSRQMHRQLLPCWVHIPTEPALFPCRLLGRDLVAIVHNQPHPIEILLSRAVYAGSGLTPPPFPYSVGPTGGSSSSLLGFGFWLRHFVFADEMLNEVILAETSVRTIGEIAGPPFEMSVSFVLVSNPVRFSFEGLRFGAFGEGASEGMNVFVDVFSPIGGLGKLFDLEANGAFKFCWKSGDRRLRDSGGELRCGYFTLRRGVVG